ncbi:MAG: hypothetical protein EBX41_00225 [Chitinophagia bacterium]|nr:hypothetical protein [Chitinophagia bacterium]
MLFCSALLLLNTSTLCAQDLLQAAQKYAYNRQYDSASYCYGLLYKQNPLEYYQDYFNHLVLAKKYDQAEQLVNQKLKQPGASPTLYIDLAQVYIENKNTLKANEQMEKAVAAVNGDDLKTQKLAKAFQDINQPEYALKVFERASQMLNNPYIYSAQMATLYAKTGHIEKAVEIVLTRNTGQFMTADHAKEMFLEWLGNDPEKLKTAQRNIIKELNQQPDNTYLAELLAWVYTQKNDWEGALTQLSALDTRNNENGRYLLSLARNAKEAEQYAIATRALDEILAKGNQYPYFLDANILKTVIILDTLNNAVNPKREDVLQLLSLYKQLITQYPSYYGSAMVTDYAYTAAQLADSTRLAIAVLKDALASPFTKREMAGKFKLQMGDYKVLQGKVWEASLLYSQVDKEYKQDILGEEARFRNAKLAYYRSDFQWAQSMLTVLKASTTELIANDALQLSVTITENVEDSNYYPLQCFARADLLLFQNKDSKAVQLLDSIATAFPKHPLNDDILMLKAKIAIKHKQYDTAVSRLHAIYEHYADDVLADDALFLLAETYAQHLNNKQEAKKYYELLILNFAGSTYVQVSRARLREL